jgi:citrate synthase
VSTFRTAVSDVRPGYVVIRGYSHEEIMRKLTFAEATFLTLVGRLPSRAEAALVNAMLTSLLDHGFVAATISAARYVASGNPEFIPAVAGGLLATGRHTLSPEDSAELIRRCLAATREHGVDEEEAARRIVEEYRTAKRRMPGFGHPVHRGGDFRADVLFELADELGLAGEATRMLRTVHRQFVEQTGKTNIPINIDGCLAALGLDLGLSPHQTVGIAVLAVLPGLMAHVIEEIETGVALKWIEDGEYIGQEDKSLERDLAERQ